MKLFQGKKVKKPSVLAALCILTALALLFSGGAATLARFLSQSQSEGVAVAKPFYFTSDKLAEDSPYYQIDPNPDGDGSVSFQMRNYADSYRRTNFDFAFTWKVTADDGTVLKEPVTVDFSGSSAQEQDLSCTVAAAYVSGGREITVTAYTEQPYSETLSARFGFGEGSGAIEYEVSSQDSAVILEIFGGNGGDVSVSWPEGDGLTPDKTNPALAGASGNSATFQAEKGVRYALVFFKKDPSSSYSKGDFTVSGA